MCPDGLMWLEWFEVIAVVTFWMRGLWIWEVDASAFDSVKGTGLQFHVLRVGM